MYFKEWKNYFLHNAGHFSHINWKQKDVLATEEKCLIEKSLQQFQRGENSEGKHLYQFAKNTGDASYMEAIKLFIKEEQTHAVVLGTFMDKHNIPRIKNHWVDGVFRFIRKQAGIENSVRVLLTAEIISKVYYEALSKATQSSVLNLICEQILADEIKHIHFQCYAMNHFMKRKNKFGRRISFLFHYILMHGTIAVVWWYHGKVLSAGGMSFVKFWKSNRIIFFECLQMISGCKTIPAALPVFNRA